MHFRGSPCGWPDFGDDTQLLRSLSPGIEKATVDTDGGVRAPNVGLDVLRVDIAPVDDDQVLDAPRDEQLTGPDEAEITRPQVLTQPSPAIRAPKYRGV